MKNVIIAVLLVTTLVFGAVALKQNQKKNEADTTIASLQEHTSELQTRLEEQEKRGVNLQTRLKESRTEAVSHAAEVTHLAEALTNQVKSATNAPNPMAEMFKNKEMRELIKTQQKAVLGPMIEKNYAPYFTALGATPEQTATVKDLIVKKSLVDANMGVSMMAGDLDADKRKELVQQAKTEKDAINDQIKGLVGDENYAQFQAYEKTIPERMQISMFKDQQASGPQALSAEQESNLLLALSEERQNFKFTTDYADQSKMDGDFASMFTEEKMSIYEQEKKQLDTQYLDRARAVLSPEQVGPFEKFLTAQTEMQKTGMKMAMQMFGGKSAAK
jgi:predicted Holliday junction resolvase-like endonuclease